MCLNLNQMLHSNVFQPKTNVYILMLCSLYLSAKHSYSGAYITKHHYQLKKDDLLDQRAKLHDKIMHLYAPMVGNRLVHSMAVKSFEDKHQMPIEDVMKIICEKRDSEALENWRCFYTKNLDELDKTFMTGIF